MREISSHIYSTKCENIEKGEWNKKPHLERVREKKIWLATRLEIYEGQQDCVFKDIEHIKFLKLKELRISNTFITSIESVDRIYLPELLYFSISNHEDYDPSNNVSFMKSIRKASWPQLTQLVFYGNRIIDGHCLPQCHFPHLEKLFIDFRPFKTSHFDDPFPMYKLQSQSLNMLQICKSRFTTQQLIKLMKKKYPKISIRTN